MTDDDDRGSPMRRLVSLRFRGVPVLTLGLFAFAACVVAGNWLPTRIATAATEEELRARRAENSALTERIRRAEGEAERLEKDPWTNERILRDQLKMSRAGEVIVR